MQQLLTMIQHGLGFLIRLLYSREYTRAWVWCYGALERWHRPVTINFVGCVTFWLQVVEPSVYFKVGCRHQSALGLKSFYSWIHWIYLLEVQMLMMMLEKAVEAKWTCVYFHKRRKGLPSYTCITIVHGTSRIHIQVRPNHTYVCIFHGLGRP